MNSINENFVHPTSNISNDAKIGKGVKIWQNVQLREFCSIGENCIIGKDCYVDKYVSIGKNCKIQNGVSIYHGVTIKDDVFVGPNATFTNDKIPRARNNDWIIQKTVIEKGSSIGANATILCGITIGEYSMIAAGAVVTKDVKPFSLVAGNPAKHLYFIDKLGNKVSDNG